MIKENIGKIIIGANVAIIAIIYIYAFSNSKNGADGVVTFGFFLTILHTLINLVIAILLSIANIVTKFIYKTLGQATKAFWLSVGLVILISFPTCLLIGKISSGGSHYNQIHH